jgi:3-oxoacyl-[acyl-carrier protein] reductase
MFRLDGKVALVTGGSRGIGRACAEALAEHGAHVVINYVKGEAAAKEVADGIIAKGGKAEILGFDVADTKAVEAGIEGVIEKHKRLDILVANAGISIDGLLLRFKEEDFDRLFAVNVKGAVVATKAATRAMMKARTGRVIYLGSVVGEMGNVGQTAYAATKAALMGVAKSVAREYASRGITANVISPGYIDTDMTHNITDAMKEQLNKLIPLGRTGSAKDIAAACVYLASDEANYVTGQVLRVNGGMLM